MNPAGRCNYIFSPLSLVVTNSAMLRPPSGRHPLRFVAPPLPTRIVKPRGGNALLGKGRGATPANIVPKGVCAGTEGFFAPALFPQETKMPCMTNHTQHYAFRKNTTAGVVLGWKMSYNDLRCSVKLLCMWLSHICRAGEVAPSSACRLDGEHFRFLAKQYTTRFQKMQVFFDKKARRLIY